MAFLSECSSMQPMPSPRSTSEAPELPRTTPCGAAEIRDPRVAGNLRQRFHAPCERLKTFSPGVGIRGIPGVPARGEQSLRVGADGNRKALHARNRFAHSDRIPHLERAHLPVEAGARGAIDGGSIVGGFADAIRGEVPQRGEERPQKPGGLVFCRVIGQQQIQPFLQRGAHFSPCPARAEPLWRGDDTRMS